MKREGEKWDNFVSTQRERIMERLNRYNNVAATNEELTETRELSPYRNYKVVKVTPFLIDALERMNAGTYGSCKFCGVEIPIPRLLKVPAALQCVSCEKNEVSD